MFKFGNTLPFIISVAFLFTGSWGHDAVAEEGGESKSGRAKEKQKDYSNQRSKSLKLSRLSPSRFQSGR